jgi:hypothetical protein
MMRRNMRRRRRRAKIAATDSADRAKIDRHSSQRHCNE